MAEIGLIHVEWRTPALFSWKASGFLAGSAVAAENRKKQRASTTNTGYSIVPDQDDEQSSEGLAGDENIFSSDRSTSGGGTGDGHEPLQSDLSNQAPVNAHNYRKVILICLAMNSLLATICISLMMPFFSPETLRKFPGGGVEKSVAIGFIFGLATYVEFLAGPLIAKDLHNAGSKFVLVLSSCTIAGMIFLFGFVNRINTWTSYLALCLSIRFVQGVSTAGYFVSSTSISIGAFPEATGTIIGAFRACNGLGYALGPLFGGFLFDHGGFGLPFYIASSALLVNTVLLVIFLPSNENHLSAVSLEASFSYKQLLGVPWVWISLITLFLINNIMGYMEPTLPLYFKEAFEAKSLFSGLALLLFGLVYSGISPLTGYIIDHWHVSPRLSGVVALLLTGVGCQLVGPAPFLHIPRSLGLSFFSVCLFGIGEAVCLTAAFPDILQTYEENNFSNPLALRAAVSGLYQASLSIGYGTGPILGSTISAIVGFPYAASLLGAVYFGWTAVVCVAALYLWSRCRTSKA